jgi:hypothetical protein
VLITLNSAMTPDTIYTVTVNNVADLVPNPITTSTNIMFRSWAPTRCGGLIFEVYNGTPGPTIAGTMAGNAVTVLTGHPSFPNSPSEVLALDRFDTGCVCR